MIQAFSFSTLGLQFFDFMQKEDMNMMSSYGDQYQAYRVCLRVSP